MFPIFDKWCCYLPKSWRRKLQCNVDYDSAKERRKKKKEKEEWETKKGNQDQNMVSNGRVSYENNPGFSKEDQDIIDHTKV